MTWVRSSDLEADRDARADHPYKIVKVQQLLAAEHGSSRTIRGDYRAVATLLGRPEEGYHHGAASHVAWATDVLAVALQQAHAALGVPVPAWMVKGGEVGDPGPAGPGQQSRAPPPPQAFSGSQAARVLGLESAPLGPGSYQEVKRSRPEQMGGLLERRAAARPAAS